MRGFRVIIFVMVSSSIAACTNMPSSTLSGPRTITLSGKIYSEADIGELVSWRCKDYVDRSGTLVEVGTFSNPDYNRLGFVLYDGGHSGELAGYKRKGLNHRWDWGPNWNEFAFVIKPDGTGLFYDFSSLPKGELKKANDIYKCRR